MATSLNQATAVRRHALRRATLVVRHGLLPIIAAAFENYPELDVAEILELCVPALADRLREELRFERQDLIREIREKFWRDVA